MATSDDAAGVLRTERLCLRQWRDDDLEAFHVLNSDPQVTEFLARSLSRDESDHLAGLIRGAMTREGFGLWAVDRVDEPRSFIGFIGLSVPHFSAHFTPTVEVGWRLTPENWGMGLATEGARAALTYAFVALGLSEVVSFTVPTNLASRRVMEKLGMHYDSSDDFDHPDLPEGHPLRRHVLYRLGAGEWLHKNDV